MGSKQFTNTYSVLLPLADLGTTSSHFVLNNVAYNDLLRDNDVHDGDPLEKDPHVTVHMGFDEKQSLIAYDVCRSTKPFNIILGKFSSFSIAKTFDDEKYHEYDVLIREIISPRLVELHKKLVAETKKLWHFSDFKSHMTYAYLRHGTGEAYASKFNGDVSVVTRDVDYALVKKFKDDAETKTVVFLGIQ